MLLGRLLHLDVLREAEEVAGQGKVALISITGVAGSGRTRLLDEYARVLEESGFTVDRVVAFEASEADPGSVAESFGDSRALLIDDAHWADATSLAMLRSRMAAAPGTIVVLAHAPLDGYRRFVHESLAETAERLGRVWHLTLDPLRQGDLEAVVDNEVAAAITQATGGLAADVTTTLDAWEAAGALREEGNRLVTTGAPAPTGVTVTERMSALPPEERRFVELAAIARRPIAVSVAAAALGVDESRALDLGESLSAQGFLHESIEGFAGEKRLADGFGSARRAALSSALGDALVSQGRADTDPATVGTHYLNAARWRDALEFLSAAGLAQAEKGHYAEAYPLVDGALKAYEEAHAEDPALEGRLRLARASCYRLAGLSEAAAEDLEVAAARLSGIDRVHAMGYSGQVADDRQLPQEAERFLAEGLLEAHLAGEQGMLGSLMTLHARTLARLGFAREADAEMEKGLAILSSSGSNAQQQRGRYNEAWVAFDRGDARSAEPAFARLVDEAEGGGVVMADRLAWWSRALFLAGRPDDALDARARSIERADVDAGPVFLAHMALAEGAIRFGALDQALEAADATLALVLQQLPAWENSARYLRARALLGLGRLDEAAAEAEAALDSCPEGTNGRRWWLRIRVLQLEIGAKRGESWSSDEAFDLTDELLQSEWYSTAARLQVARAHAESDPSLAAEAMALATQIGVADIAAEAAEVGSLWKRPESAAVATAIKTMRGHVPDDWQAGWESMAHIRSALDQPDVDDEAYRSAVDQLAAQLDDAFEAAGLGMEGRLVSPAQRRARGLRRRRRPFRWTPVRVAAAVLVVAGLGLGGGFLARALTPTAPGSTVVITTPTTAPTTTLPPEIWDVELGPPEKNTVVGTWEFGGEINDQVTFNTGASVRTGVHRADGYYWKYTTGGRIQSAPAAYGQGVVVASEDGSLYGFTVSSGGYPVWTEPSTQALVASPTLAYRVSGSAQDPTSGMYVYFGGTDGTLRIRGDALLATAELSKVPPFEGQILAAPVVLGSTVFVGTSEGVLHAVSTSDPYPELWTADLGSPIDASPAAADGTLYVGTEDGVLWAVDAQTGEATQCYDTGDTIVSPPVIVGDTVFIPARNTQQLIAVQVGTCRPLEGSISIFATVASSPAYADGVLYTGSDNFVLAFDVNTRELLWQYPAADSGERFDGRTAWPVVADGVLYFTTDEPFLYAVDIQTHELLWRFRLDGRVVSRPAIMDGAVIVGDLSGTIVAIGCTNPPACN